MEVFGFAGSILYIDLTAGAIRKEPLDPELIKKFIGGWGINHKLAYDLIPPEVDPYSPDNKIILGVGPFVGTTVPGSSKIFVTSKFPVGGAFTGASGGGALGIMLKSSGYDHVVISGQAEKPVYLNICDDDVKILDAADLWGMDAVETASELRRRHDPCSILPIGQAGENLVKFSVGQIDNSGTLGQGGLPSVMGSKRVKAIVALQGTKGVKVADRRRLNKLVGEVTKRMMSWHGRNHLIAGGLGGSFLASRGDWPVSAKNMTELKFRTPEELEQYTNFARTYSKSRKTLACPSCPMGDKEIVKIREGRYAGTEFQGNSICSISGEVAFSQAVVQDMPEEGAERAIGRLKRELEYADMLDRYGIDFITFDRLMSLVVYLYEQGMLTREDTGGIELKENWETAEKLAQMIAYRKGRFGEVLADGIPGVVRMLGKGEDLGYHIKGVGNFYEPRFTGMGTMEFASITSPRGSQYITGSNGAPSYNLKWRVEQWVKESQKRAFPDEAIQRIFSSSSFNVGRLVKWTEDWYSALNSVSLCCRYFVIMAYNATTIAALYEAVTGLDMSEVDLLRAGERAWNLYKVLNARAGFGRKDDKPPEAWFRPCKSREKDYSLTDYYGNPLSRADVEKLLDDYYDERGWDKERGIPTPDKLDELGLEDYRTDAAQLLL
ncbi:MAG: aldehyde ferredoxin oxidoreductase C-terminal domain-containing protein [Thermodesulfobacteriota bacterium]|nr:aldehyde ferredoxin oxidoreductase C-terminal domain-containing protein [Thermodesulfobacteriota bacterium]